jgi:hypothetical protein
MTRFLQAAEAVSMLVLGILAVCLAPLLAVFWLAATGATIIDNLSLGLHPLYGIVKGEWTDKWRPIGALNE